MIRFAARRMRRSLVVPPYAHVERDSVDRRGRSTRRHVDLVDDPFQDHVQSDGGTMIG